MIVLRRRTGCGGNIKRHADLATAELTIKDLPMRTSSIPTIETERLRLRPATPADLDVWTSRIFADPAVTRSVPSRVTEPRARAERMLSFITDTWTQRGYGEWLVTDKMDGQLIGHCGFAYLADTNEIEVDYALATAYWGKGIATEALRASLRFGFEVAQLEQLIGLVVPENTASRRVLEHAGFVYQRDAPYFGLTMAYHTLSCQQFQATDSFYRIHDIDVP
jgi:RimJ/RimL family protein N-acetyltransferase